MGILALAVGAIVFFFSWIPVVGIGIGIPGGVISIILGAIGMSVGKHRVAGAAGFILGLLALVFKLMPGINLL